MRCDQRRRYSHHLSSIFLKFALDNSYKCLGAVQRFSFILMKNLMFIASIWFKQKKKSTSVNTFKEENCHSLHREFFHQNATILSCLLTTNVRAFTIPCIRECTSLVLPGQDARCVPAYLPKCRYLCIFLLKLIEYLYLYRSHIFYIFNSYRRRWWTWTYSRIHGMCVACTVYENMCHVHVYQAHISQFITHSFYHSKTEQRWRKSSLY